MRCSTTWCLAAGYFKICFLASLVVLLCFSVLSQIWLPSPSGQAKALAQPRPSFVDGYTAEARMERLARVCRQYRGQTNMQIVYDRFWYDKESNSLYCRISKAGSTSYYYTYLQLALQQMAKEKVPTDRGIFQSTMFGFNKDNVKATLARHPFVFAVTRHPYERLVSAYVDFKADPLNFAKWGRETFCQGQKAGCDCGLNASKCQLGSFLEFLTNVVLREARDCEGVGCIGQMNVHWTPMDNHCSFCALNYSLLSSMDTFSQEHERVASILGVKVQQGKKREHVHTGAKITMVTRHMFSNVSKHILESINRIYRYDLEMFGYTPYPGSSSSD